MGCSRFSWVRPRFGRTPRSRTLPPPDPPKFRVFSISRHNFLSFSLFGVLSLNFGGVFEGPDPEMCTFGLSGCRVNSKRAHFRAPALQTPPKFHEKTKEREERKKIVAGRNFGPPTLRGPTLLGSTLLGSTLLGSTFSGFGYPPWEASTLRGITVRAPPSADALA